MTPATSRTVLTTADRDGWWWACPVRSVTPVSEGPRVVSVRVPRDTSALDALTSATAFAVHVLHAGQEALATRLAADPQNFAGVPVECGFGSVPLLRHVATRLDCRPVTTVRAGDTVLVLAEVVRAADEHHLAPARPA